MRNTLQNTGHRYGWIAIVLHWLTAVSVLSLLGLGIYMVELDYYDPLYNSLPFLHKSIGMLFALVLLSHFLWCGFNLAPAPLAGISRFEQRSARIVHALLLLLSSVIVLSGYLISTADGAGISVFELFAIPASVTTIPDQADNAGLVQVELNIEGVRI